MSEFTVPDGLGIELAEALWRLDRLPVAYVEDLATTALLEGHDGPALRELAWPQTSWVEVGGRFEQALREMGRLSISREEAIARLIRHHVAKIVSGELDPLEGAHRTFKAVWGEFDSWEDYDAVLDLERWANMAEGEEPDQAAPLKAQIIERSRELLERDPVELSRENLIRGRVFPRDDDGIGTNVAMMMVMEVAPGFQDAWRSYCVDWKTAGEEPDMPGLTLFMGEFARYVGTFINQGNRERLPEILSQVEWMMHLGSDEVKNAVATGFVEGLLNRSEIPPDAYVPFLGPDTADYARAWDRFTGLRTPGLWENESGE